MGLIDFILNLAALLLWVNWRTAPFNPQQLMSTRNLMGTLKRADSPTYGRWIFLGGLLALLFVRAVLYWIIGPAVNWTAQLDLGAVSISFRSDYFDRMLWYSVLSFAVTLVFFHMALLFVSLLRGTSDSQPAARLTRTHLGTVDAWPRGLKLAAPLLVVSMSWWVLSWPLSRWDIVPHPASMAHRFQQALLLGLGSYLLWKFMVAGFLALHLLNTYVYFGKHPIWNHVDEVSHRLLTPFRRMPLRVARLDFAPVAGIVLAFLLAFLIENGFRTADRVDEQGQRTGPVVDIPGLVDLYQRVNP